jgi:MoxR-like ATPase
MDRFFIRLSLEYPDLQEEMQILETLGMGTDYSQIQAVTSPEELLEIREELKTVYVSEAVRKYIVMLVQATRSHEAVRIPASPRASRSLYQGAITYAAMHGRDYVIPEDVQAIFHAVLGHRILLHGSVTLTKKTETEVLDEILEQTLAVQNKEELFSWKK